MRKYARFQLDDTCQAAFDSLKMKLVEMVILAYSDANKVYKLMPPISRLVHVCHKCYMIKKEVEKPIYFLSHMLSDTQTRWSTIEKEVNDIHYALRIFTQFANTK